MKARAELRGLYLPGRVVEVKKYGDRASVRLDRPDPTSGVNLVRHDGRWCLSFRADPPS